jgi:hypothetical protein
MTDDRLTRARALLAREGLEVHVSMAGAEAEILTVHTGPEAREMLASLAPELRAFGFRYVTIELGAEHPMNPGNP